MGTVRPSTTLWPSSVSTPPKSDLDGKPPSCIKKPARSPNRLGDGKQVPRPATGERQTGRRLTFMLDCRPTLAAQLGQVFPTAGARESHGQRHVQHAPLRQRGAHIERCAFHRFDGLPGTHIARAGHINPAETDTPLPAATPPPTHTPHPTATRRPTDTPHPTPTATPRPTYTPQPKPTSVLLYVPTSTPSPESGRSYYGPTSGVIRHDPADGKFETVEGPTLLGHVVIEATLHNPDVPQEGRWLHGFVLRKAPRTYFTQSGLAAMGRGNMSTVWGRGSQPQR